MKRKTLIIFLVIMIILSFAVGCSKKVNTTDNNQENTEVTAKPETKDSKEETEEATLTVFSYAPELREDYERVFEAFRTANPGISIDYSVSPGEDYPQLLKTKVSSGDSPDVYTLWPGLSYVVYYAKNGHLMDLTDQEWVKNIVPGALTSVTYEDKVYAQPVKISLIGVVYNKTIFDEMNLSIPKTWEEYLKICETIKQAGKIPIAMPVKTDWPAQFLPIYTLPSNLVYSKNPNFDTDLFNGKVNFFDSNYKLGFEMFMELNDLGYYNPAPLGVTFEQSLDMMARGDAVMAINGNWLLQNVRDINPDFEAGMFPVPAPEGYQTTVSVGGDLCHVISSQTENKAAALKLLEFLASQEAYDLNSNFSTAISALSNITTDVDPAVMELMVPAANEASYSFTNITWVPGIQEAFQRGYQQLFAGEKTIEQVLADVDEIAVRNIESFKKEE